VTVDTFAFVRGKRVAVAVPGGELAGWRSGSGPPVLLLHGGPGLGCGYLDDLVAELAADNDVVLYQQRGVPPSTTEGPFTVARAVADVVAVLDALGWERAWIAGHSWGGLLLVHVLVAEPGRVLGGLALDPLGATGDGGGTAHYAELLARTPEAGRARIAELDARFDAGEGTPAEFTENMRILWPAYFATREDAPPFPDLSGSPDAYGGLVESSEAAQPALQAALPGVRVPFGCVVGAESPLPFEQGAAPTAAAIPGAWIDVVDDAGHAPWYERPGCVAAGMRRLMGRA
jgi:proline iminopeptidase